MSSILFESTNDPLYRTFDKLLDPESGEIKGVLKPGQCSPGDRAAKLSIYCSIRRLRSFDCAGAACATYMCLCRIFFSSGQGLAGVHGLSGGVMMGCNGGARKKAVSVICLLSSCNNNNNNNNNNNKYNNNNNNNNDNDNNNNNNQ